VESSTLSARRHGSIFNGETFVWCPIGAGEVSPFAVLAN